MTKKLVSIIIVNYKTADLVKECIQSIKHQDVDAEVIIVDNASGNYDRDVLSSIDYDNALNMIFNSDNVGFAKASNQGVSISEGEYVLFLNPDTLLFQDCLKNLIDFYKSSNNIGAVTPRLWLDKNRVFLMPPADMPSVSSIVASRLFPSVYQKNWLKKAVSFWDAVNPIKVNAISGAFILTKREILSKTGAFDERFPLYFEDSDLCLRIKKTGFELFYFPNAEAVHYYNQSAKSSPEAIEKFMLSEKLYFHKHYRPFFIKITDYIKQLNNQNTYDYAKYDFSEYLKIPPIDGYLLFSPVANFTPCAAHRVNGEQKYLFDEHFVNKLAFGTYYLAIIDKNCKIHQRYQVDKK